VVQIRSGGTACAVGRRCLVAGQIVLKGVIKGPDGMLAVVENQQRKSYFLRENDPVFNGQVLRITPDSIVFREKVLDNLGHERTREVVKRIAGAKPAV
jgi:Tfp pilus assembly protein PilP